MSSELLCGQIRRRSLTFSIVRATSSITALLLSNWLLFSPTGFSRQQFCILKPYSTSAKFSVIRAFTTDFNMEKVARMRGILQSTNSWEQCWSEDVTPWDIGGVTPIIADLVRKNDLPSGRAFVPGCGSGYDVVALATPVRHVVGLDISETAVKRARQMALTSPSAKWVEFICTDFFTYSPATPFDLIFDYTFFCALEPSLRSEWAAKMAELLAPGGELITIIFPVSDHEGGPPYAVSLEAYEKVLHPWGLRTTFFEENPLTTGGRKGQEFLGRWTKISTKI